MVSIGRMASIVIAIVAVVGVFVDIPIVSDYAFWILVGAFLVWAVADLRSSYARDQRNAMTYPAPNWGATIGAVLLGVVMWIALLGGLHLRLFGESPT